jgi:hypothetical protein
LPSSSEIHRAKKQISSHWAKSQLSVDAGNLKIQYFSKGGVSEKNFKHAANLL